MTKVSLSNSAHLYASTKPIVEEPPLPEAPTAALPGSREKVEILMERADQGCCLWHPNDRDWATPNAK